MLESLSASSPVRRVADRHQAIGAESRSLRPEPGDGIELRGIEQARQKQLLFDLAQPQWLDPAPPSH